MTKLLAPNYCLVGCDAMHYIVFREQPSSSNFLKNIDIIYQTTWCHLRSIRRV